MGNWFGSKATFRLCRAITVLMSSLDTYIDTPRGDSTAQYWHRPWCLGARAFAPSCFRSFSVMAGRVCSLATVALITTALEISVQLLVEGVNRFPFDDQISPEHRIDEIEFARFVALKPFQKNRWLVHADQRFVQ